MIQELTDGIEALSSFPTAQRYYTRSAWAQHSHDRLLEALFNTEHLILWLSCTMYHRPDIAVTAPIRLATAAVYSGICMVLPYCEHACCVFRMLCQVFPHAYSLRARSIGDTLHSCTHCHNLKYKPSVTRSLQRDLHNLYDSVSILRKVVSRNAANSCNNQKIVMLLLRGAMANHIDRIMASELDDGAAKLKAAWTMCMEDDIPLVDDILSAFIEENFVNRDGTIPCDCASFECPWGLLAGLFNFEHITTRLQEQLLHHVNRYKEKASWGLIVDTLRIASPLNSPCRKKAEEETPLLRVSKVFQTDGSTPESIRSLCANHQLDDVDVLNYCSSSGIYQLTHASREDDFTHLHSYPTTHKHTAIESHPVLPYFITGTTKSVVQLWDFDDTVSSGRVLNRRTENNTDVTRIRFDALGQQFGVCDAYGLYLWRFCAQGTKTCYAQLQCHNRGTNDFTFLNSLSCLATVGYSSK